MNRQQWARSLKVSKKELKQWSEEIPLGSSLIYWALLENKLPVKEYLCWAKDHFKIPSLNEEAYDIELDFDLWKQLQDLPHWSCEILPITEWDGTIFIGCIEPNTELTWDFPIQYILVSPQQLDHFWTQLNDVPCSETISRISHHNVGTTPTLDFPRLSHTAQHHREEVSSKSNMENVQGAPSLVAISGKKAVEVEKDEEATIIAPASYRLNLSKDPPRSDQMAYPVKQVVGMEEDATVIATPSYKLELPKEVPQINKSEEEKDNNWTEDATVIATPSYKLELPKEVPQINKSEEEKDNNWTEDATVIATPSYKLELPKEVPQINKSEEEKDNNWTEDATVIATPSYKLELPKEVPQINKSEEEKGNNWNEDATVIATPSYKLELPKEVPQINKSEEEKGNNWNEDATVVATPSYKLELPKEVPQINKSEEEKGNNWNEDATVVATPSYKLELPKEVPESGFRTPHNKKEDRANISKEPPTFPVENKEDQDQVTNIDPFHGLELLRNSDSESSDDEIWLPHGLESKDEILNDLLKEKSSLEGLSKEKTSQVVSINDFKRLESTKKEAIAAPRIENLEKIKLQSIWKELHGFYKKSLITKFNDKEEFHIWICDSKWDIQEEAKTVFFNIIEPSSFKVVVRSRMPFHGPMPTSSLNQKFIETCGLTELPEHVTIVPLLDSHCIVGFLFSIDSSSTSSFEALAIAEECGGKISDIIRNDN